MEMAFVGMRTQFILNNMHVLAFTTPINECLKY